MIRISALNDDEENSNEENEILVTKEAQETIAVSEYMRALSYKKDGRVDDALFLFSELLETEVLADVTANLKDDKLFSVKYNCYRHIGFIYAERKEHLPAMKNLYYAMELDDTDVYTMSQLGQIALKLKNTEVATVAFNKSLARNPNHWPSIDGMLQVYCLSENILEAYGWALHWYNKENTYDRAYNVLVEITERFGSTVEFFETLFCGSFKPDPKRASDKPVKSNFPGYSLTELPDDFEPLNINYKNFRLEACNWLTVGRLILNLYKHLEDNNNHLCTCFTFNQFLKSDENDRLDDAQTTNSLGELTTDSLTKTNSPIGGDPTSQPTSRRQSTEDGGRRGDGNEFQNDISESGFLSPTSENIVSHPPTGETISGEENNKSDTDGTPDKPNKSRRRGSELSILEQWGWHKNRRSTRKKSTLADQNESIDTSVNGFLRRIMPNYFTETIDIEKSPFSGEIIEVQKEKNVDPKPVEDEVENRNVTIEEFQEGTQAEFQSLISEIDMFDIFIPIKLWLEKISVFWNRKMPEELYGIYVKMYELYLRHYDIMAWHQLEKEEFEAVFRTMLFYLELSYQQIIDKQPSSEREIPPDYRVKMLHLSLFSGYSYSVEEHQNCITRLIWVQYNIALLDNDLSEAIENISRLEFYINDYRDDFKMFLPNQKTNNKFDLEFLATTKTILQRKLALKTVKKLFDDNNFVELEAILKESLINTKDLDFSDNTPINIHLQMEGLMESLWKLDKDEELLLWTEKCLSFSIDKFLKAPVETYRQEQWADSVNFSLGYIDWLLKEYTNYLLRSFSESIISRLVQNLTRILSHQLDSPYDKNNQVPHPIDLNLPWIILHQILQRDEDRLSLKKTKTSTSSSPNESAIEYEEVPSTVTLLFTAHDYMGRKAWCSRDQGKFLLYILDVVGPQIRGSILEPVRDLVMEYVEQVTYCLYGYPERRARLRHIEEHDANQIELTWERAIQLFDIYRPESLPGIDSYKLDSISAEMEKLLNKILPLVPRQCEPAPYSSEIRLFISGVRSDLPEPIQLLPSRISCIYYLLADYHFKNRDFSKTIRFYSLDLTMAPNRFDSWAGIALSKATKLETLLNSCQPIECNEIFTQSEETLRCFEQCIKLQTTMQLVWIEYGSFAYYIHAFCARNLRQYSDTLSMERFEFVENKKEECINIALKCFETVNREFSNDQIKQNDSDENQHDERWLHHYMLGKISEKKKEPPTVYMSHYRKSAKFLYENNATYPIKINHSNPQNLSIEALEIFYRISASIIKYLEQHTVVRRDVGKLFLRVLKDLKKSPFAMNQAKIDDSSINALKRKMNQNNEDGAAIKFIKLDNQTTIIEKVPVVPTQNAVLPMELKEIDGSEQNKADDGDIEMAKPTIEPISQPRPSRPPQNVVSVVSDTNKPSSPSRRGSHESGTTTTTTTTTTGNSSSSSSSSSDSSDSDSSTSDSDSDSSSENDTRKVLTDDDPYTEQELETIYKMCVKNFEECVTRFPEHYKSVYRLVNHYMHAPDKLKDFEKCKQLLLGTYKTSLGNNIQGLFTERKTNNFFHGIWRIPPSEIDRPGSFSSHLSKCVIVLMEVLKKSHDFNVLFDLALQLQKTPEADKRYIKDSERDELFQQAISFCVQTFRSLLKHHTEKNNDTAILDLMLEIYNLNRKCIKHMYQKERLFNTVLADTYKAYVKDKVRLPSNPNFVDLAMKLCQNEITLRKNIERVGPVAIPGTMPLIPQSSIDLTKNIPPSASIYISAVQPPSMVSTSSQSLNLSTIKPTQSMPSIVPSTQTSASGSGKYRSQKSRKSIPSTTSSAVAPYGLGAFPADPNLMAAMVAMAMSTPNIMNSLQTQQLTEENLMSSIYRDFFMLNGGFAGLPSITSLMQSGKSSPSTSNNSPKPPSTSMNMGLNQVTITKEPKSSLSDHRPKSRSNTMPSNALPSVLKKDLPSSSFSAKLQEVSMTSSPINQSKNQNFNIPRDLPKSLSITPSAGIPANQNEVLDMSKKSSASVIKDNPPRPKDSTKYVDKIKPPKKSQPPSAHQSSYNARPAQLKQQDDFTRFAQFTAAQSAGSITHQEYNRQMSYLASYQEFQKQSLQLPTGAGSKKSQSRPQSKVNNHHPASASSSGMSKTASIVPPVSIRNNAPNQPSTSQSNLVAKTSSSIGQQQQKPMNKSSSAMNLSKRTDSPTQKQDKKIMKLSSSDVIEID